MSAPSIQPTVIPRLPFPTTTAHAATSNRNRVAPRMAAEERLPAGMLNMYEEVVDSQVSYTDSSSALFALYLSHADKHDKDQTDSWKADADGILVFVRSLHLRHHERGTDEPAFGRLVCSQQHSPRSSSIATSPCCRTRRETLSSSSLEYHNNSTVSRTGPLPATLRALPSSSLQLAGTCRLLRCGSTCSGS